MNRISETKETISLVEINAMLGMHIPLNTMIELGLVPHVGDIYHISALNGISKKLCHHITVALQPRIQESLFPEEK